MKTTQGSGLQENTPVFLFRNFSFLLDNLAFNHIPNACAQNLGNKFVFLTPGPWRQATIDQESHSDARHERAVTPGGTAPPLPRVHIPGHPARGLWETSPNVTPIYQTPFNSQQEHSE